MLRKPYATISQTTPDWVLQHFPQPLVHVHGLVDPHQNFTLHYIYQAELTTSGNDIMARVFMKGLHGKISQKRWTAMLQVKLSKTTVISYTAVNYNI